MPKVLQIPENQEPKSAEDLDPTKDLENPAAETSSKQNLDVKDNNVRLTDPIRAAERLLGKVDSKLKIFDKSVLHDEKRAEISPNGAKKANM